MRKPVLCHMRTTKAQISLRIHDRIMHIVAIFRISRLQLASVAEQAGLSLTWSQTPEHRLSQDVAHFQSVIIIIGIQL